MKEELKYKFYYAVEAPCDERNANFLKTNNGFIMAFETESEASRYAEGRGWYGSDGWVVGIKIFSAEELLQEENEKNKKLRDELDRKNALAKLSEREKRLLGLG